MMENKLFSMKKVSPWMKYVLVLVLSCVFISPASAQMERTLLEAQQSCANRGGLWTPATPQENYFRCELAMPAPMESALHTQATRETRYWFEGRQCVRYQTLFHSRNRRALAALTDRLLVVLSDLIKIEGQANQEYFFRLGGALLLGIVHFPENSSTVWIDVKRVP